MEQLLHNLLHLNEELQVLITDKVCFSETDPVTITVLDQVNTGFILANQSICREPADPLTVDVNDLVDVVANAAEPDDGIGDGIYINGSFQLIIITGMILLLEIEPTFLMEALLQLFHKLQPFQQLN